MVSRVKTQPIEWKTILPTIHLAEDEYLKSIKDFTNKYF